MKKKVTKSFQVWEKFPIINFCFINSIIIIVTLKNLKWPNDNHRKKERILRHTQSKKLFVMAKGRVDITYLKVGEGHTFLKNIGYPGWKKNTISD